MGGIGGQVGLGGDGPGSPDEAADRDRSEEGCGPAAMFVGVHERNSTTRAASLSPRPSASLLGERCYLVYGDDRCVNVFARDDFERMAATSSSRSAAAR